MSDAFIARLQAQLNGPRDGALLRFSLANALLQSGDAEGSVRQCTRALDFDEHYSAAWKLLGKAHRANDDPTGAGDAWRQGIRVAAANGDRQAEKEMTVFLKRLDKTP